MKLALIFDGSSILYRSYYALPKLTTKDGRPTGAIFGAVRMISRLVRDLHPTYWALASDTFPTFRNKLYAGYKETHDRPDDVRPQFDYLSAVAETLNLPDFKVEGFEADDVINSLTRCFKERGCDVVIESTDTDLFVLIDERTVLHYRDKIIDSNYVRERFGIEPFQVSDFKALSGDKNDEVPGIKGIGDSRARQLLDMFPHVEDIRLEEIEPRLRSILEPNMGRLALCKSLTSLRDPIPDIDLEKCLVGRWNASAFLKTLEDLEIILPQEFLSNLEFGGMKNEEIT